MLIFAKIFRLWRTLKYLKSIQIYYRLRMYICVGRLSEIQMSQVKDLQPMKLIFKKTIEFPESNKGNSFVFLNIKQDFGKHIDWEFCENGRLWAYNLNYFEYLDQQGMLKSEGVRLIQDYMNHLPVAKIGLEPYPLSLRCFNWIRFSMRHNYDDQQFVKSLYAQLNHLTLKPEYHLLGNHLLENGFALLFGAYYFNDAHFYLKAKEILIPELKEQILMDGAHFELSPMYHSTILFRVLDCYNLISSNELFHKELEPLFGKVAKHMFEWLNRMSFRDGAIPLLNDAAFCIAPTIARLEQYVKELGLSISRKSILSDSGYRKFEDEKFEIIFDIGKIGPDYQPGHAHADTFNFELHINGRPVIVDTGTSTYEASDVRFYERSTAAHNTVVLQDSNSSDVWGVHRVGKRAKVSVLTDTNELVSAVHDGYKNLGSIHSRTFEHKDGEIKITDKISCRGSAYLHFAPDEKIEIIDNLIQGIDFKIKFGEVENIVSLISHYSPEFNKKYKCICVRIDFKDQLETCFI